MFYVDEPSIDPQGSSGKVEVWFAVWRSFHARISLKYRSCSMP